MTLTISKCKLSKQQHTITLNYTLGENEKNSLIFTLMICRNFFAHRNAVCKTRDGLAHLTNFGELIGFEKKLVTKTEYGTKLPNITNSIDVLNINTDAIKDSIVDGINANTLAMIPTDNLTRSYPFTLEPRRPLYCPVSSNLISDMRFYVTGSLGRPVDFNGIDWFMTLLLHSR